MSRCRARMDTLAVCRPLHILGLFAAFAWARRGREKCVQGADGGENRDPGQTLCGSPLFNNKVQAGAGRCLSAVPGLGRPLGSSEKEAIMQQPVMALWLKRRVAAKLLLSWEKNWLWEQFSIWSPISGSCLCYFQTARLFRLRGLAFV